MLRKIYDHNFKKISVIMKDNDEFKAVGSKPKFLELEDMVLREKPTLFFSRHT